MTGFVVYLQFFVTFAGVINFLNKYYSIMKKISLFFVFLMMSVASFTVAAGNDVHGDLNGDGKVSITDVTTLINYLLSGTWPEVTHGYVDLGLPSGTLWATCNIGAYSPEDYGDYIAWGETAPRDYYEWVTYKWCNGSSSSLTKYNFTDSKIELDLEDDAAYVNWGPSWRMPTRDQMDELKSSCSWQWVQYNGVNGQLGTGPNGNKIFLPAAGSRRGTGYELVGSYGRYWSRNLIGRAEPTATGLFLLSATVNTSYYDRCEGLTIRPVRAPQE